MVYAAKCYWPGVTASMVDSVGRAARDSGYLGSLLFPDDELVLCLFDAASPGAVVRASERAGIPCERVMESVWLPGPRRPIFKEV